MRLYGDPVLRRKAKPVAHDQLVTVSGFSEQTLREVADTMLETMFEQRGVGLAAPQIGLSAQLFVAVEYNDDIAEGQEELPLRAQVLREFVMLNPKLSLINKKKDRSYQEGCLSIPEVYEEGVPRALEVRVDYTDLEGQPQSIEADDYLARVFQHEIDHLRGVLFIDHLPASFINSQRQALHKSQQYAKSYLKYLAHWQKQQEQA